VILLKSEMKRNMLTHLPSELAKPINLTLLISIVNSNCIAAPTSIDIIMIVWTMPMFAVCIYRCRSYTFGCIRYNLPQNYGSEAVSGNETIGLFGLIFINKI